MFRLTPRFGWHQSGIVRRATRAFILFILLIVAGDAAAQSPRHPLDALTPAEYWAVFEAMKASGRVDEKTRYHGVNLREPPKSEVLEWKAGAAFRREALVIVKQGPRTFEALVDVAARKVIEWREVEGVQPVVSEEEFRAVDEAVKALPEWQEAMRRRGITDFETVQCAGLSPGYFGTPEEQGRRIQRVFCQDRRGVWNAFGRPIEGLIVVWDMNEKKVIRIIDTGPVPVPKGPVDFDVDSVGPLREIPTPIHIQQPMGVSFRLNGNEVSWQKWQFHFRLDPRVGVVVSNVRYTDGDKARSVLYQGSLSEIFVPYMDPSEGWYHWTFIDAGEAPGGLATPLEPGSDCPANAVYFDGFYTDSRAIPQRRSRSACLFERDAGDMSWRHWNEPDQIESRKRRDLVLRMIATIGNYDYVVDWTFLQDGTIKILVGATGIDAVKGVRSRTAAEDADGKDGAYGRFVAENTVAVNHDHYFSFRLDLDVDGAANSLLREKLVTRRPPAEHPRKSFWVVENEIPKSEQEAKLHIRMEKPELWRVINPAVKGPLGYPVSYEIKPGHNAMTLLLPEDYPRRRAGFIDHHLWVTPYHRDERYAAGDYPTQSKGGDGLPAWTRANRAIENTDIVVWYTMGFHHVPRVEDWPVMPTAWHGFELRPFNFFSRNPALDLPK